MLTCIYAIKLCRLCCNRVEDIENGGILPVRTPRITNVSRYLEMALQQANLDRQAGAQLNEEILKEQIYDGCVICLEEFNKNEKIRVLVSCQHSFHGHCINEWLLVHRSCPICRLSVFGFCGYWKEMFIMSILLMLFCDLWVLVGKVKIVYSYYVYSN